MIPVKYNFSKYNISKKFVCNIFDINKTRLFNCKILKNISTYQCIYVLQNKITNSKI